MIGHWTAMNALMMDMGFHPQSNSLPAEVKMKFGRFYALALFQEVAELVDSFSWKPWREGHEHDRENMKREIVDCLHFLHHIAVTFDIKPEELSEKFVEIDTNNRRRYVDGDFSGETESQSILDMVKGIKQLADQINKIQEDK